MGRDGNNILSIFVAGTPRPAGSKSSFQGRITHAGQYTKKWMDSVNWTVQQKVGRPTLTFEPVILKLTFHMSRPSNHYGTGRNKGVLKAKAANELHVKRPDLTKLTRAVEDALTGLIWKDDSQVVAQQTVKCYTNHTVGVQIDVERIVDPPEPAIKNEKLRPLGLFEKEL